MASKLVVFVLVVTICKVQSAVVRYFPCTDDSLNAPKQASCNAQQIAPQNFQTQPSNSIKASPHLQIVPGQGYNLQAIPFSELNRGQLLNLGYNIPQQTIQISPSSQNSGCNTPQQSTQTPSSTNFGCNSPQQNIQVAPTSQVQSSPAQLIQPSLCGPSSVITAPVSTITIPPNDATTIIDYSLSNCLANALQMLIANEFYNCAINKNVNQESIPTIAETVPGCDLAGLIKSLNANQLSGVPVTSQVVTVPNQGQVVPNQVINDNLPAVSVNDWENLLDRLRDSGQCDSVSDWEGVLNYLNQQNGLTVKPTQEVPKCSQKPVGGTDSGVLEALAAYLGCDVSEVSSNSYPNAGEIYFPEEIPCQLICTYGYMPTTVPVINFSVQPVNVADASTGFIVGC